MAPQVTCPQRFLVFGAGAWGTAVAIVLARAGRAVTLVPRRPEQAALLGERRSNPDYLPGHGFPRELAIVSESRIETGDFGGAAAILACPMVGLRETAARVGRLATHDWRGVVVNLAKGLEAATHALPHAVLAEVLPGSPCTTLSGPSNAAEVVEGHPTAVVLAGRDAGDPWLAELQVLLSTDSLRVYRSGDLAGVELGASLKNVYAIAAGVVDGLGLGDNTKAALITRALAEMVRLGTALGARPETLYGLGGLGDLVATCTGGWSRNRTFGEAIGRGRTVREAVSGRSVVEGFRSSQSYHQLCVKRGLEAPILAEVFSIVHEGKPPAAAIASLMGRGLKRE